MAGLSKVDESKTGDEKYTHQAGIILNDGVGTNFPGLLYREIPGGKFARFRLSGAYAQLPLCLSAGNVKTKRKRIGATPRIQHGDLCEYPRKRKGRRTYNGYLLANYLRRCS